jgi:hypothetical protein
MKPGGNATHRSVPIKAPGVSRGIGCHAEPCAKRSAYTIAYAPGLYGAWCIGSKESRPLCRRDLDVSRIAQSFQELLTVFPREPK